VTKRGVTRLAGTTVTRRPSGVAASLSSILDSPELTGLIDDLESLRWTGRKGYPTRSLVGACLVKSLYAIPTWSRTAGLIAEHSALQAALGSTPSVYACYRFAKKLRDNRPALDACFTALASSLRRELPDYGRDVAIDASDLPAYANGQRFLSKEGPERQRYSDPDASWGHRSSISTRKGGGFYGYKIHAAVCARTDLPVAWQIETAKHHESQFALPLLDVACVRGFQLETCTMDKAYDSHAIHDGFEQRDCRPITAQIRTRNEATPDDVPTCEHGRWTFAGADFKRKTTKWRCPAAKYTPGQLLLACSPASVWIRADRRNPLIPRSTKRFGDLYRGRGAVERAFGRLKHEAGLAPLRLRGIENVALHADLCVLATLAQALARARAVPLAA
jgi:IS5 family transposase